MIAFFPLQLKTNLLNQRVPWANALIVGLNVASYLLWFAFGWQATCGRGSSLFSVVLYGFSHAGFWHLAFNMWGLVVFGNAVNRRVGNRYYLLAYFGSVMAIGLLAWLFLEGAIIGASGAVFAVIGIGLLLLPSAQLRIGYVALFPVTILVALVRRPREIWQWLIRWDDFSVPMLWCLAFVPLLEIWGLVWSGWSWTHLGHLLGLVCGIAFVLLLPNRVSMRREPTTA